VRKTFAGFASLIVVVTWLLAACGSNGSVSSAVRSIASSITATRSSGPSSPAAATSSAATTAPPSTSQGQASSPASSARPTSGSSGAVIVVHPSVTPGATTTPSPATTSSANVIDAYAKGAALHDAMAAAETPGALAADNAPLRWSDIQRRADDYGQLLYGMQQTAPSDQDRLMIADVLASLRAARSAMDTERASGSPDAEASGLVRARLAFFATALDTLRQSKSGPRDPQLA
jgi:hypothetical protein